MKLLRLICLSFVLFASLSACDAISEQAKKVTSSEPSLEGMWKSSGYMKDEYPYEAYSLYEEGKSFDKIKVEFGMLSVTAYAVGTWERVDNLIWSQTTQSNISMLENRESSQEIKQLTENTCITVDGDEQFNSRRLNNIDTEAFKREVRQGVLKKDLRFERKEEKENRR